jgi:hypothetical protein
MLVSNQSLGSVLDAIAAMARSEIPDCHCVILLRQADSYRVGAAPGVPASWLSALLRGGWSRLWSALRRAWALARISHQQ